MTFMTFMLCGLRTDAWWSGCALCYARIAFKPTNHRSFNGGLQDGSIHFLETDAAFVT
jgi:hypothetical protein